MILQFPDSPLLRARLSYLAARDAYWHATLLPMDDEVRFREARWALIRAEKVYRSIKA